MGQKQTKTGLFSDSVSFTPGKISKSASKEIKAIYIDTASLPSAGIYIVGTEFVENYSENGTKLVCSYQSPSKITSSSFSTSNCRDRTLLALGCEDQVVTLLHASDLQIRTKISINFKPGDLVLPNYKVECSEKSYFEKCNIDSVLFCFHNTLLVGLSTGFTKQFSLESFEELKVFNPVALEYPPKENSTVSVSMENAFISGIESLVHSAAAELIFVNHKSSFNNCLNRSFTLPETPICLYKKDGEAVKRFKVQGDILGTRVMEHRSLYLCLTSIDNQLCIFNFSKFTLIKVCLDFNKDPKKPLRFLQIALCEFGPNERSGQTNKLLADNTSEKKEDIDGDVIFGIENSGSILISKLTYENEENKFNWMPLKYINANHEDEDLKQSIQKNVLSKGVFCLEYEKQEDKLYFSDLTSEVIIMNGIVKKVLTQNKTAEETQVPVAK